MAWGPGNSAGRSGLADHVQNLYTGSDPGLIQQVSSVLTSALWPFFLLLLLLVFRFLAVDSQRHYLALG